MTHDFFFLGGVPVVHAEALGCGSEVDKIKYHYYNFLYHSSYNNGSFIWEIL